MRIEAIVLRSGEPEALRAFYAEVFGAQPCDNGFTIGAQRIELRRCDGRDAEAFAANATGFQHFALPVRDIAEAYAHLQRFSGWRPISLDGPQRLPAASGGASAFKFRDPDGHPLELLQFPPEATPEIWRARFASDLFPGVDHSAITVSDAAASEAFYARLGFVRVHAQRNAGPEQARLDGFAGVASAQVDVVSLAGADGARPGLELLAYLNPATTTDPARNDSVAATRLRVASLGSALARDPDGHRLEDAPAARSG